MSKNKEEKQISSHYVYHAYWGTDNYFHRYPLAEMLELILKELGVELDYIPKEPARYELRKLKKEKK